jgi:diguanylate cyclase (GGDEF)-like protein/PAS domain S-box-containing protein
VNALRSTFRTALVSAAAWAIPVFGTLSIRPGLPALPDLLWALGLLPVAACALRWRLAGAAVATGIGTAFLYGTLAWGQRAGMTPAPVLGLPLLTAVFAAAAIVTALVTLWLSSLRSRSLQALTDPLTGLPNRRHAELFLEHEFAVAELGRPFAVLLLDVDRYTSYATSAGDAAAQGMLRALGSILRQNTRSANLSAHWGNDRFACLLVGTSDEGALIFARRLQEQVRATGGVAAVPSVSIGIAAYDPEMRTAAALVRAAEHALHQAKRDGGDRIRFHGRATDELDSGDATHAAPITAGGHALAYATAEPSDASAAPRSAFVFGGDPALRRRAAEQLERRGIRVTEGSRAVEGVRALAAEFDLVVVDLTNPDAGVHDLVREVRRRHPATRVLGIPGYEGNAIDPATLAIRADGHLLRANGAWLFQPALEELLHERDRLRETTLRALQLSDEVRAKEREARRAREESEAKLRTLVQSIREVLFRTDRSGAWISLSPAWSTLAGYPVEQCLGRPWLDYFHEDDRAALAREFDALTSVERPYLRREARLRTRTGGTRWVEVRAQLAHDRHGNVLSASGTLTDITERRRVEEALHRSEEHFRALIENAADLIAVVDADGRVRYASPAAERILGHQPEDGAWLPGLDELIHADDLPAVRAALRSAESPGSMAAAEMRARHADGSWRHLSVTIRNLSHLPAVRGYVVNAHDVTAHHEAERMLRESEDALYRARKMDAIGMLAGGIAHDFNNVLTSIQGHLEVSLAALASDHPIRADLLRAQESAVRASSLTRQLLAFGRRQVLRPRVIDLNVFVSDMQKMLVRLVGDQVQLRTELAASPGRVQADPMQIERVILNLAVNAREAMPHGGVITIRTSNVFVDSEEGRRSDVQPGAYVALSVSDTGHGISPEIVPHIFDPFFTTKPQAVGVGLGLSTVYGIVRQSGGHTRVDSTYANGDHPGGTTFTAWLPAASEAVSTPPQQPQRRGEPVETIALVEDEQAVRELATRILRGRGYTVIPAENGRHALDLLTRYPSRIDMLLTDVVMPEMSGRDLADRIGTMRPGLKILFMSGYSAEAVEQHGVLARGSAFIEKPFSPDALLSKVREMLDQE